MLDSNFHEICVTLFQIGGVAVVFLSVLREIIKSGGKTISLLMRTVRRLKQEWKEPKIRSEITPE